MQITDAVTQKIITKLLKGQDYRIEVITLLNAEFLEYCIDFFKKVAIAKCDNKSITSDWYKNELLNSDLPPDDLIINSGLNKKTIVNMYNTGKKEIVIDATNEHYDQLYNAINILVESGEDINLTLGIKFRQVSVELNINESLIVISSLAAKKAQLRGGMWSTTGKQVEKKLMLTLCKLYQIPLSNFKQTGVTNSKREVDFYLIDSQNKEYKCEVKLMGKGNPESADVAIARKTDIFIADKLSDLNKSQLNSLNIQWIEFRSEYGYRKLEAILQKLNIPHHNFNQDIDIDLAAIFQEIFNSKGKSTT